MILSFHPCYNGDKNIICSGRLLKKSDIEIVIKSKFVILPQGCTKKLYRLVSSYCKNIFPNFNVRFMFPGKVGQTRLFRLKSNVYPETWEYDLLCDFINIDYFKEILFRYKIPFIFKFDWGGEGSTVFFVKKNILDDLIKIIVHFERTGNCGFMMQQYVKFFRKILRVVVIGKTYILYWKIQDDLSNFGEHLNDGAHLDNNVDYATNKLIKNIVMKICNIIGINLAGLDFIINEDKKIIYLLEINYFFGRRGIGGSKKYYKLLKIEIERWINSFPK